MDPPCRGIDPLALQRPAVERILNIIWMWVMEPMLFVTIGASINFSTLSTGTIPKALLIIGTGALRGVEAEH